MLPALVDRGWKSVEGRGRSASSEETALTKGVGNRVLRHRLHKHCPRLVGESHGDPGPGL